MYRSRLPVLPTSLLAALACTPAPESAGFVTRLGVDTTAIASASWSRGRAEGVYVNRVPATTVTRWQATLTTDDQVERLERTVTSGDSVVERVTVTWAGDTVVTERTRGDSTTSWRAAAPGGVLPRHPAHDPALLDVLTRRLVTADLPGLAVRSAFVGDTVTSVDSMARAGSDSVRLGSQALAVDPSGRLLGMGSTERVPSLDIEALAAGFAGRPLGMLSPADSVVADVGGAAVRIEYSRPWKRGREIFGGLVPWDAVWRTGANNPTTLATDRDLVIGGTRVPAGTYVIWTLPSAAGWKLILSTNTGEDAGQYIESADLARIDLTSESLDTPVEQFTLAIEPGAGGAVLRLSWDLTAASVPIRRR